MTGNAGPILLITNKQLIRDKPLENLWRGGGGGGEGDVQKIVNEK